MHNRLLARILGRLDSLRWAGNLPWEVRGFCDHCRGACFPDGDGDYIPGYLIETADELNVWRNGTGAEALRHGRRTGHAVFVHVTYRQRIPAAANALHDVDRSDWPF